MCITGRLKNKTHIIQVGKALCNSKIIPNEVNISVVNLPNTPVSLQDWLINFWMQRTSPSVSSSEM